MRIDEKKLARLASDIVRADVHVVLYEHPHEDKFELRLHAKNSATSTEIDRRDLYNAPRPEDAVYDALEKCAYALRARLDAAESELWRHTRIQPGEWAAPKAKPKEPPADAPDRLIDLEDE